MYRELTAEDHRRVLGIIEDQLPAVLLIVGAFDVAETAARFSRYLDEPAPLGRIPGYLASRQGLKVAVAAAFGGPMAALIVHTWCGAGVRNVVQLGWYGALQPGTALADVVVPRHAERQDGVSDWYLAKGILADASPDLAAGIADNLRGRGVTTHEHGIYSTSALLAESREVIADWSRHGYHGVDMETAATFAVAKSMGARRAAALIRFDDLIAEEHSLADEIHHDVRGTLRAREPEIVVAVLEAVGELEPAQ